MDTPNPPSQTAGGLQAGELPDDLPPGDHPLEIAARKGFGPLSPLGREVWHGDAMPCVTCGQLVRLDAVVCEHCEQDLSPTMLEKMRAHAGPWYVLEHVRPFPGISLARVVRQIRRGLITETSIVRGPATDHQWRFAAATPGLCRYFSCCWRCHKPVMPADLYCRNCRAYLLFDQSHLEQEQTFSTSPKSEDPKLRELKAAIDEAHRRGSLETKTDPLRLGGIRVAWIVVALVTLALASLLWLMGHRGMS